jgi:hypothetical protein
MVVTKNKFKIQLGDYIRWALDLRLLILAWENAHWSIALIITFIAISIESLNFVVHLFKARIERLERIIAYTNGFKEAKDEATN